MFYFIQAIKKSFVFSGRATRKEYLHFIITVEILAYLLSILPYFINNENFTDSHIIILIIFNLLIFFPHLSVSIRRLHDVGVSGWWVLLLFAYNGIINRIAMQVFDDRLDLGLETVFGLAGLIPVIILGCLPSSQNNRVGTDAKKFTIK